MQTEIKKSASSNTQIKQTFEKFHYKRQGRTLHNDQGINPRRRYNNYNYICTQHRSTAICKVNANKYKRGN